MAIGNRKPVGQNSYRGYDPEADDLPKAGDRRRRLGLLESAWQVLSRDATSALLGAQDREHPINVAQIGATEG